MFKSGMEGEVPRVTIARLGGQAGRVVELAGWVYRVRGKGKILFLLVRDGSGIVQCVCLKQAVGPETFDRVKRLAQETSILVRGEVRDDARAPGGHEIDLQEIRVVQEAVDYPITPKEHGTGFLMEHRHLWLRSRRQMAVMRIRDEVIKAIRDFFYERDYFCVDSPIFTPNACEGTTNLFPVKYFDEMAYLTQSGQLYAEASAMALGKVYCFGPTFRAEKSKTRRHLTEFWMVEPEVAFADLEDVMALAEDFVAYIVQRCLERRRADLEELERDLSRLERIEVPFPRLSYDEAVELLHRRGHDDFRWGDDFGAPHETAIGESQDRPVLVHRFPHRIKAFYMKRDPENEEVALCVDMIAPEGYGEIIGGSEREDDLATLERRVAEHELPEEAFRWYFDLRRFGSCPHGGFGLGLERTVAWICGVKHLRECIPYPRMLDKIYP